MLTWRVAPLARYWILAIVLACGGNDELRVRVYKDEGEVCLTRQPGGSTTHIVVVLDECASYCDRVEASCEASVVNGALELHAQGTARTPASPGEDCPTACQPVAAQCELPSVTPGSYELHYKGEVIPVQLPPERPTGSPESCQEPDLD